jgi:hypothetical protein
MHVVLLGICFAMGTVAVQLQDRLLAHVMDGAGYGVIGPALIALCVLAALLVGGRLAPPVAAILVMAAPVPTVAVAHMLFDQVSGAAAHWNGPVEIAVALFAGLVPSAIGAALGMLLQQMFDAVR